MKTELFIHSFDNAPMFAGIEKGMVLNMRKKGAILSVTAAFGCLALAAGAFLLQQKKQTDSAQQAAVIIEAGEKETLSYARIDSIVGNDLEVSVMEKAPETEKETSETVGGMPEGDTGTPGKVRDTPETGEKQSLEIPVGTEVVTKLGAVTTFQRLSAGDVIALLCREDTGEILEVYIVE